MSSLTEMPGPSRFAGIMTTAELTRLAGMSRPHIRRLVCSGELLVLGRGVYARADLALRVASDRSGQQALRLAAALALTGTAPGQPAPAGSHRSAAVIHGLDLLSRAPAGIVDLTRPPGAAGSRSNLRPGVRLHVARLPGDHVTTQRGVRVTSVARTVVDLARTAPFRDAVVVADSALRTARASKAELRQVITDCARWPGLQRARQVVDFSDALAESALESISRVAFRDQGLPPPELQVWVGGDEGVIGRADFLWRRYAAIAEADGAIKYADPSRAIAQLQRDARLRAAGFEVVHFTWQEITVVPAQVAAAIRTAFRRAAGRARADR